MNTALRVRNGCDYAGQCPVHTRKRNHKVSHESIVRRLLPHNARLVMTSIVFGDLAMSFLTSKIPRRNRKEFFSRKV